MFEEIDNEDEGNQFFEMMYKITKSGKVVQWTLGVIDNISYSVIAAEYGQVGNKLRTKNTKVTKGKNKGKANATTHFEQACAQAQSMFREKQKEGYKTAEMLAHHYGGEAFQSIHDANSHRFLKVEEIKDAFKFSGIKFNTDNNNRVKPMLAEKFKQFKDKVVYPALIQPKFNGVRCTCILENGVVKLISRKGKEYELPHISSEMLNVLTEFPELVFDGEIYQHDTPLQEISSLLSDDMFKGSLQYYIYDVIDKREHNTDRVALSQRDRFTQLELIFIKHKLDFKHIFISPTIVTTDENLAYECATTWIEQGYEGAIVRNYNDIYHFGFRDTALLKIKHTTSNEFKIIGTSLKDGHPPEDFVWKCETYKGNIFEVKPHGTVDARIELYRKRTTHIGNLLQLSFHEYTNDGIPFHITEVTLRNYE